ncbi:hypothetical protein E2542_SST04554 [Spatholobus suberectus]|nr:hypothetical protein E2542_SST04554 [Spatholobus suberectus]
MVAKKRSSGKGFRDFRMREIRLENVVNSREAVSEREEGILSLGHMDSTRYFYPCLQELQQLPFVIQENFKGCESVNEAEGRIVECNSNGAMSDKGRHVRRSESNQVANRNSACCLCKLYPSAPVPPSPR